MKNRFIGFVVALLGIVLAVTIPFVIANDDLQDAYLTLYIVTKCLYLVAFAGLAIYFFIKGSANTTMFSVLGITALFQFVPLGIRALAHSHCHLIYPVIVLIGGFAIYLALVGALMTMNAKMVRSDAKYVGKEIPVEEEKATLERGEKNGR